MAEAVSFAASIITIIQVSGKLISVAYDHLSSFQKAPKDIRKLAGELHTLIDILQSLRDYLDKNPLSPALQKLGERDGPLAVFAEEMNRLHQKFKATDSSKFSVKIVWPLKDKHIAQTLLSIERHKTIFIFAMNADQLSLLRVMEAYVIDIGYAAEYIKKCLQDTACAIQEIKTDAKKTTATVQEIKSDMEGTNIAIQNLQSSQDVETRVKILNWLYPQSFETRHIEISGRRREKTGEWLLKSREFCELVENNQSSPILCGYGIPGAGKTFLSSAVIDHFQDEARKNGNGVAYIYFNYNEQNQQQPLTVLSSLVKQLASQMSQLPSYITGLHTQLAPKTKQPNQEELYSALVSTLTAFDQVFLVFDALDECDQNHQRKILLPLFHRMVLENSSIRIFLTSRHYPEDIQISFEKAAKIELRANDEDIKTYIQQEIDANHRAKRLTSKGDYLNKIISELTKAANGMFLLVHFHIDLICQQTTTKKIMIELENLRADGSRSKNNPLDPTYNRAIESIRSQPTNFELAKRIFAWLMNAQRTLTLGELQRAITVEPDIRELEEDDLPSKETILDVCAGLAIIDENSGIVRLAHYTVQEYLSRVPLNPDDMHTNLYLAKSCISFLLLDIFSHGACDSQDELRVRLRYPFLEYAVSYLPFHLRHSNEELEAELVLELFGDPKRNDFYSQMSFCYKGGGWFWEHVSNDPTYSYNYKRPSLHQLCSIGHLSAIRITLEQKDDVMARCPRGSTALHSAVCDGHQEAARLLINHGADVTAGDLEQETPLHKAAQHGRTEVAQLLIEHGANVSAKDSGEETPLHMAAQYGKTEVAQLLIEHGADVSARGSGQETPLHVAAGNRKTEVVQLLIEHGADVSARNSSEETPLHNATGTGVAQVLIEHGADVCARDWSQETPLHKASWLEGERVVQLLLEHGADVSARNLYQQTPLHWAAEYKVAQLLIEHGADISARNSNQETPLHIAAKHGRTGVAQLLIEHGADLFAVDSEGRTPLRAAELNALCFSDTNKAIQLLQNATRKRRRPEESEPPSPRKRPTILENRESPLSSDVQQQHPSIDDVMNEAW